MAKRIITKKDRFFIDCDFYNAGMTEDGEDFIAESYFVVIERIDGQRLAHNKVYLGCEVGVIDDDEEGQYNGTRYFGDVRKEAKVAIEELMSRILDAGVIDTDYWIEMEPAYGSDYYCIHNNF